MDKKTQFFEIASLIINECDQVLRAIDHAEIEQLVIDIEKAEKVFLVGVGRVMFSLQSISKRWNHIGIKTICVGQIDEPPITQNDLLIVGSRSGETIIPVSIANKANVIGAKIGYIGTNSKSAVGKIADIFVNIPINNNGPSRSSINSKQPMSSLFEQSLLLLGDAIAMMIIGKRGLQKDAIIKNHANLE